MGRNAQLSQIYRLGRVLRGIETAFIYNDYQPVSTTQIMDFAFALGFYQGRKSNRDRENYSRSIRRACARVCVKVGKAKSRGAPWLQAAALPRSGMNRRLLGQCPCSSTQSSSAPAAPGESCPGVNVSLHMVRTPSDKCA
jgi:hypothetical protein